MIHEKENTINRLRKKIDELTDKHLQAKMQAELLEQQLKIELEKPHSIQQDSFTMSQSELEQQTLSQRTQGNEKPIKRTLTLTVKHPNKKEASAKSPISSKIGN